MSRVSIDKEQATVMEQDAVKGRTVLTQHAGKLGTIVLAVRRPGCMFCREQAMAFHILMAQQNLEKDFGVIGIIKETVDKRGVVDFQNTYFPYTLYCDKSYAFYQALGDRKVGASFVLNPKALVGIACETYLRITSKDASTGFVGEGLTLGGIIFFDVHGKPKYAYEEETGKPLPVKDFMAVVNAIRRDKEV
jgi:peroxiredoxin